MLSRSPRLVNPIICLLSSLGFCPALVTGFRNMAIGFLNIEIILILQIKIKCYLNIDKEDISILKMILLSLTEVSVSPDMGGFSLGLTRFCIFGRFNFIKINIGKVLPLL